MRLTTILMAAFGLGFGAAGGAAAAPITGGETTVAVTTDLAALGLAANPFGTASLDAGPPPLFTFDITGGEEDGGALLIEHDGSGVELFALNDMSVSTTIGNFLIDTAQASVFGDVIGGAEDLTFFTFGTIDDAGIELLIAPDLAGALTVVFGAPDLEEAVFGLANTAPDTGGDVAPIPVPAAGPLALVALALLWITRRRRAA